MAPRAVGHALAQRCECKHKPLSGKYRRMSKFSHISLSALELPSLGEVPEWVHLVPRGQFGARDGRGPWRYGNAQDLITASFAARKRIHIDLNHSTETAAKQGLEAPAVGYVTEMEERTDGIWGRVDWTRRGKELLADRAYWGISPVIQFDKSTGDVHAVARAALTNDPALTELTPLSTEETQEMFLQKLAKMLGLGEDASEEDVTAALQKALDAKKDGGEGGGNAALASLATALGAEESADVAALTTFAKTLTASKTETAEALTALQAEVKELRDGGKTSAAEAFVDQAIRDRRVGVKSAREEYVALHVENPERCEKMIAGLPKLDATNTTIEPPKTEGTTALSAQETDVAAMLGIDPEKMAATKAAEEKRKGAL